MGENYIPGPALDPHEKAEYKRLRALADKWDKDRQAFMLAKLKKGDHPDTDPHFWDGAPDMPVFEVQQTFGSWWQHDVMTTGVEAQMALGIVSPSS